MGNNTNKILGASFMMLSGLFYTTERVVEEISRSILTAGSATHETNTYFANYKAVFFDNFFVWSFFFIGFILLASGFPKSQRN